jgi:hypothetical protein
VKLGDFWPKKNDFSNPALIKRNANMPTVLKPCSKTNQKILWTIATVLVLGTCLAAIGIGGDVDMCIEIAIANGNNAGACESN